MPSSPSADGATRLDAAEACRRHAAAATIVRHTPITSLSSVGEPWGGELLIKAECLQRTGSFKLRGALSKLAALGPGVEGVTAGSAGNHGQAVAYAARASGLRCAIFVPERAAVGKIEAIEAFGAEVRRGGRTVDECLGRAGEEAERRGWSFIHAFDDPDVVLGQAGVGIEIADDPRCGEIGQILCPVGGGGLAAGIALTVAAERPDLRLVGVQARACGSLAASVEAGEPVVVERSESVADGIAVRRPGGLPWELLEHRLDEIVEVGEEAIVEAMAVLAERAKLVVEGAGAVGIAAVIAGAVKPQAGATLAVLSGGNVDAALLAHVLTRHEATAGRRVRLEVGVDDRPGGLAELLAQIAAAGVNVIDVVHRRDEGSIEPGRTTVALQLETRGHAHVRELLAGLAETGFDVGAETRYGPRRVDGRSR